MHPLSRQLINSACSINIEDATDAISKIRELSPQDQKKVLLAKNNGGFNPFHALCATYLIKDLESQNKAILILNLMIETAKDALSPEEFKQFYTDENNNGYTPLHSSVQRKNYTIANNIIKQIKEFLSPEEYRDYLGKKNKEGFDVKKTYETTVALGKERNYDLEKEFYPKEYQYFNPEESKKGSQVLKLLNKKHNGRSGIKAR